MLVKPFQYIVLSRTDNLGDVMLTLPLAGILKHHFPGVKVGFIGKAYTRPLIDACTAVDVFIDRADFIAGLTEKPDVIIFIVRDRIVAQSAFKQQIKTRIGTSHRLYHWLYCNIRVSFSRKNSNLHETQLNHKLLQPLGLKAPFAVLDQYIPYYHFNRVVDDEAVNALLQPGKTNIIIHPKSKGSAKEWPLSAYLELVNSLPAERYHFLITGTEGERQLVQTQLPALLTHTAVTNVTGKLSLNQLITLISKVDALVACSTGPLHIAAALGKTAIGIYPPTRPIHPGRWAPIGYKARVLVVNRTCNDCSKTQNCHCIAEITPAQVKEALLNSIAQ